MTIGDFGVRLQQSMYSIILYLRAPRVYQGQLWITLALIFDLSYILKYYIVLRCISPHFRTVRKCGSQA
jgi:hypothetical protein